MGEKKGKVKMYYYSVGEDVIKKYRVIFSVDSLRNIEKDLIKDCNIERCNCYMTYGLPHRSVGINYKKFEYEKIGVKEDFYGDLDIYEVNTIELINPYLYEVIEKIIGGNTNSLEELFSYKVECVNEKEKNIAYYVDLFQREFSFELIDTLDLDIYNKVSEFLGLNKFKNKEINLVCNLVKSWYKIYWLFLCFSLSLL